MAASSIRPNQVVEIDDVAFRLIERLPDAAWRVQNMGDRTFTVVDHETLLHRYSNGTLKLRVRDTPSSDLQRQLDPGKKPSKLGPNGRTKPEKLIQLPNGDQRSRSQQDKLNLADAKKIRALLEVANQHSLATTEQQTAIRDAWQGIFEVPAPEKLPAPSTIYRWNKRLNDSGGDLRSLIPRNHLKGRTPTRLCPQAAELLDEVVDEIYLNNRKRTMRDVADELEVRIKAANGMRPKDDQLPRIPFERIKEFIAALPAFDKHAARYGVEAARRKFRTVLSTVAPSRPLERVELDATRLDVIGVDDNGIPLGRPWLHICIDVCTRVVLGFCISYEPPSLASLFACVRHALLPKSTAFVTAMGLDNPWPFYGAWERLVLDNGLENHSASLDSLGALWGMQLQFCPRLSPWYKAKVERFLRTINTEFCHSLPGTTFSNIVERGDYAPQREATLHWKLIERLAAKFINDVYHRRTHRALGCSPAARWAALVNEAEIALPCDPCEVIQMCRTSESRRLTHKGIESLGLFWNSDDLRSMRHQCGADIDVKVYFDRFNLDTVGVEHPRTKAIIEVGSVSPAYTKGLTRYQHLVVRRFAGSQGANDDEAGYQQAKAEIRRLVAEASSAAGYKAHGHAARFLAELPATASGDGRGNEQTHSTPNTAVPRNKVKASTTPPAPTHRKPGEACSTGSSSADRGKTRTLLDFKVEKRPGVIVEKASKRSGGHGR